MESVERSDWDGERMVYERSDGSSEPLEALAEHLEGISMFIGTNNSLYGSKGTFLSLTSFANCSPSFNKSYFKPTNIVTRRRRGGCKELH